MWKYIQRVRAARREERCAQEALNFDYEARIHANGPWEEDDTYLRLNANSANASAGLLNVLLRRTTCDDPYAVCKEGIAEKVGMTLRHCTQTERGAMLADRWDRLHDIDTANIELVEDDQSSPTPP